MKDPFIVLLKDIRQRLGLSQRGLAQHLGVTMRTVGRWERGVSEMPRTAVPRAISLLRARDPEAADRLGVAAKIPGVVAQDEARRASLDGAVFAVADRLDLAPRRAREVLATFLTHLVAAGLTANDARTRLAALVDGDRQRRDETSPG